MRVSASWCGGARTVRVVATLEPEEIGCSSTVDVEARVRAALEEIKREVREQAAGEPE